MNVSVAWLVLAACLTLMTPVILSAPADFVREVQGHQGRLQVPSDHSILRDRREASQGNQMSEMGLSRLRRQVAQMSSTSRRYNVPGMERGTSRRRMTGIQIYHRERASRRVANW